MNSCVYNIWYLPGHSRLSIKLYKEAQITWDSGKKIQTVDSYFSEKGINIVSEKAHLITDNCILGRYVYI